MIDGPYRGQHHEEERPHFTIHVVPRSSYIDPWEDYADLKVRYHTVTYEWSWSLSEWCMVY